MAGSSGARRIAGEQRVFSLLLALIAAPEGATKRELLSSVYGYSDRFRRGESNPSLDRQFERDKDQIRSLGIPIDTMDSPLEPGNNQLTRYRISKDRLSIPGDVRFSERELELLRLAAVAWREGSLTAPARQATMKLEALGAGLDVRHLGVAPRIGSAGPAAGPLQRAIQDRRAVRFPYQLPERDEPLEREVAPLRLHRADGRWHLVGFDLERRAPRVFLLSRIVGPVATLRRGFDAELLGLADGVVERLLERAREQPATIRVRRGSVAEARLAPRALEAAETGASAERELVIGTLDYREHALADELAGYGADVVVLGPDELRAAVVRRLRDTAAAHGGRQPEGGADDDA